MASAITLVSQISPYHCVPACLESFFIDNGKPITQQEIVDRCPDAFGKGTHIEGALNATKLGDVSKEMKLNFKSVPANVFGFQHPKQAVFIFTFWEGDFGNFHCVRLGEMDQKTIRLMNPAVPQKLDEHDTSVFSSWPQIPVLVEFV